MFGAFFTEKGENDKVAKHVRNSAGIAVFVGPANDQAGWIAVGRACERFALQATALGVRTAHLNQPIEVASLRPDFANVLGVDGRRPDLVVRFGRGPTLRRPLQAVLVQAVRRVMARSRRLRWAGQFVAAVCALSVGWRFSRDLASATTRTAKGRAGAGGTDRLEAGQRRRFSAAVLRRQGRVAAAPARRRLLVLDWLVRGARPCHGRARAAGARRRRAGTRDLSG